MDISVKISSGMLPTTASSVFDIFVSYAGEDRDTIVRPLVEALRARGYSVWFDDDAIGAGDGLQEAIRVGIRNARYGVVIISKSYLTKDWPRTELLALWMYEKRLKRRVVLPILHGMSAQDVCAIDSVFEDRVMPSTKRGLEHVVDRVTSVIQRETPTRREPIGRLPPNKHTWRSLLDDLLSLPLEASGVMAHVRGAMGAMKIVIAYAGGFFAILWGQLIALAVDWRVAAAEARLLAKDMTAVSYEGVIVAILAVIYLWVRTVWLFRERKFGMLLAISVLLAGASQIATTVLVVLIVRAAFPSWRMQVHTIWGAAIGAIVIGTLFLLGKLLVTVAPHVTRRYGRQSMGSVREH